MNDTQYSLLNEPVELTFSKELVADPSIEIQKPSRQLRLYSVFDNDKSVLGQLFNYPNRQLIRIDHTETSIQVNKRRFKEPTYLIRDNYGNEKGEAQLLGGGINYFWEDVPSNPNVKITLESEIFNLRKVAYRQHPRSYKYLLYKVTGKMFAEYSFSIDSTKWRDPHYKYIPFSGTITTNISGMVLFVPFFFFELIFDIEDVDDN